MRKYCLFLLPLLILQCKDKPTEPVKVVDSSLTDFDSIGIETPEVVEVIIPDLGGGNTATSSIPAANNMVVDESSWDKLLAQGRPQIAYPNHPSVEEGIYRIRYQDIALKYYLEDIIALHSYLQAPTNILTPEQNEFSVLQPEIHRDRYTAEKLAYPLVRKNYHTRDARSIANPDYLVLKSRTVALAESRNQEVQKVEQLIKLYSSVFTPRRQEDYSVSPGSQVFFYKYSHADFTSLMYKNQDLFKDWLLTAKEDQFQAVLEARPKTGMVTSYPPGMIDLKPEEKEDYLAALKARPITAAQFSSLQQIGGELAIIARNLRNKRDAMEAEYKAAYPFLNPTELELLQVAYAASTHLLLMINGKEAQLANVLGANNTCEDLMLLLQIMDNSRMDWSAYLSKSQAAAVLKEQVKAGYLAEVRKLEEELRGVLPDK